MTQSDMFANHAGTIVMNVSDSVAVMENAKAVADDCPESWRMCQHGREAWNYIHSPEGREMQAAFIKLALYCKDILQKKIGAKAIAEKLRWDYEYTKPVDAEWKINNNHIAFMARHAMDRVHELRDYFDTRGIHESETHR